MSSSQRLTKGFDNYAENYDDHFTNSPIGKLQRQRVHHFLFPLLKPQSRVLEINCGTGHDAICISEKVEKILATDISEGMIKVALRKKERLAAGNLEFRVADSREIHQQLEGVYDLLFSNFGGLNCLAPEEIQKFSRSIAPFIVQGGKLVLVVMGRKCLMEDLYFFYRNGPSRGRRKSMAGIGADIAGNTVTTYYYSPRELTALFSGEFSVIKKWPVGIFIPPGFMNDFFGERKSLLNILNLAERTIGRIPSLADYGDHYLLVLQKLRRN